MSVSDLMAARLGRKPKTTEELMQELNQFSRLDRIVGNMGTLESTKGSVSVFTEAAASKSTKSDKSDYKKGFHFYCHNHNLYVLMIILHEQKAKQQRLLCPRVLVGRQFQSP